MSIRRIHTFPDPILSKPAQPVRFGRENVTSIARDLVDTLTIHPGVGLAATQIGIMKNVCIVDAKRRKPKRNTRGFGKFKNIRILVNPVILKGKGSQIFREGCLSIPDLLANIHRYESVKILSYNLKGEKSLFEATGFEAVVLQHEIDHLDGKIFLDRVSNLKTDVFRRHSF